MNNIRPSYPLLLMLITAFVTMQWSATHIHLADQHDHDGSHHQHQTASHTHHPLGHHSSEHNSTPHHDDAFVDAQPEDNFNVVELDQECHSPNGKLKTPSHAVIASYASLAIQPPPRAHFFATPLTTKAAHLLQSTIQLRAPPLYA